MVAGSNPAAPTSFVNDFVNNLLAMIYSQGKQGEPTEFLTLGRLQIGTPKATQQWVDEFLASRRQGISQRTLEFYRDILYRLIGTELTAKGINAWLTSLNVGNAKLNYYQATKIFCNWLYKSKKINSNPADLVDRPKIKNVIPPAVTEDQLDILLNATDNFRDKCILKLFFDSGCRLSELVGIKDTDFDWKKNTVIVTGKTGQRKAPYGQDTCKMLQHADFGEIGHRSRSKPATFSEQIGHPLVARG